MQKGWPLVRFSCFLSLVVNRTWSSLPFISLIFSTLLLVKRDLLVYKCHQHEQDTTLFLFLVNVSLWRRKVPCTPPWLGLGTDQRTSCRIKPEPPGGGAGRVGVREPRERDSWLTLPEVLSQTCSILCESRDMCYICNYPVLGLLGKTWLSHDMKVMYVSQKSEREVLCYKQNNVTFKMKAWRKDNLIWFSPHHGSSMESTGKL